MCGLEKTDLQIDQDYTSINSSINSYNSSDKFLSYNFTHLDKNNNFIEGYSNVYDKYSTNNVLEVLITKLKPDGKTKYSMASETHKILANKLEIICEDELEIESKKESKIPFTHHQQY
jgi:hypothetical protein